ncbi:MAG: helix-turn-helix domain-containing protein [Burkholderiaceae bacterium]|jgi:transcriptional regulator with XRE-family HTH domain|nr:helix-turn-helix domain-containing protein [Burkholderiaceae bacterium]
MKQPTSSFAQALRTARKARGVPQEEFDTVSSRTYISALERGIKQPTIAKVDALAGVLGLHPLTLFTLSYGVRQSAGDVRRLLDRVEREVEELLRNGAERGGL